MKQLYKIAVGLLLCSLPFSYAMAQEEGKKEETKTKEFLSDVMDRIIVHGYAQAGYTYNDRGGDKSNTFDIKRTLFFAHAAITDRWFFMFMHDFNSQVQEYYTDYRLTDNKALTVRFGQFKNGLTYENKLSPTSMEAIDVYSEGVTYLSGCGSDPLMGVQYGRDLGAAVYGEFAKGKVKYEVDVMNGQGINKKDGNNFKDVIGRLEVSPAEGLNIIATGQIGRGNAISKSPYNPTIEVGDNYRRNRYSIGFDYKSRPLNVHGEYLEGKDGDVLSRGYYVTGCVPLIQKKLDLVGSYDFFNFNTTLGMDQHKAIFGIQWWYFKQCRFQVQYVYKSAMLDENRMFVKKDNNAIMCQMQIRFN